MKKQRLLPFRLTPAAWGLKGDAYDLAQAHYDLDGEDLDRAVAAIQHRDNPKALARQIADVDHRYGRIDTYAYDHAIAAIDITDPAMLRLRQIEIDELHAKITSYQSARKRAEILKASGTERDLALLEIDHAFNHLSKNEYEKRRATLRDEPWVAIINSGFDPQRGLDGVFFEFDWNEKWIEFLKSHGFIGQTDEQVVDDWFTEVCRSHTTAELAGSLAPSRNLHRE